MPLSLTKDVSVPGAYEYVAVLHGKKEIKLQKKLRLLISWFKIEVFSPSPFKKNTALLIP